MIRTVPYLKKFAFYLKIFFTIVFLTLFCTDKVYQNSEILNINLQVFIICYCNFCCMFLIFVPMHSVSGGWRRRLVCKIPLLARALGLSARATIGYLVYKKTATETFEDLSITFHDLSPGRSTVFGWVEATKKRALIQLFNEHGFEFLGSHMFVCCTG